MKKFEVADIVVLNVADTAFGPDDNTFVDEVKHAIVDEITGEVLGWEEEYGQAHSSNQN